jgi:two-component system, OmpR family, response regulator CpxR
MSIIKIFNGTFCHGEDISREVAKTTGLELLDDRYVISGVSKAYNISESKLFRTLAGKVSAFNNFTHERGKNISCMKMFVSDMLGKDGFILSGFCTHLVPSQISHVLSVCVIAELNYRVGQAVKNHGLSNKEAYKAIQKEDEKAALFTKHILNKEPWDPDIYDILIPTSKVETDEAVKLIVEKASSGTLKATAESKQSVKDFLLSAEVELETTKAGHDIIVESKLGKVTLTIDKHTLMLASLEEDLKKLVSKISGVTEVETKVGPGFYQAGVYRQMNLELPSKVLLVDDEREFVQTLSERIQMREMGSAVVYDGEEALSFVEEEEPEVMVLDLKMPGIDGMEVLRRIKRDYPDIEVIVLTGHGSEKDEEQCMELGAFAYLNKPVDLEKLSRIMKEAYAKVNGRKKDNS